ncbi:hypothetical protein BJX99DRAFT_260651 [Aspergillus californicus]
MVATTRARSYQSDESNRRSSQHHATRQAANRILKSSITDPEDAKPVKRRVKSNGKPFTGREYHFGSIEAQERTTLETQNQELLHHVAGLSQQVNQLTQQLQTQAVQQQFNTLQEENRQLRAQIQRAVAPVPPSTPLPTRTLVFNDMAPETTPDAFLSRIPETPNPYRIAPRPGSSAVIPFDYNSPLTLPGWAQPPAMDPGMILGQGAPMGDAEDPYYALYAAKMEAYGKQVGLSSDMSMGDYGNLYSAGSFGQDAENEGTNVNAAYMQATYFTQAAGNINGYLANDDAMFDGMMWQ